VVFTLIINDKTPKVSKKNVILETFHFLKMDQHKRKSSILVVEI